MRKTLVTIATILIYMLLCYANIVAAACPQTLEPLSFWFETDPPFSEVDQITIAAELANATASNFVFSPTGSNNFQLWSSPGGIATMPVTVNIAPSGVVVPGQSFSFELVVDVSSLPSTENRLCFRVLEGGTFGTLTPSRAPLVSSSISCIPSTTIPTLNEWGMIIFSLLMAGSAFWFIRKERHKSC